MGNVQNDACKCFLSALTIHLYFLESYNEDSDEGYFLEVEVQYPKGFRQLHNYLSNKKKLSNLWST